MHTYSTLLKKKKNKKTTKMCGKHHKINISTLWIPFVSCYNSHTSHTKYAWCVFRLRLAQNSRTMCTNEAHAFPFKHQWIVERLFIFILCMMQHKHWCTNVYTYRTHGRCQYQCPFEFDHIKMKWLLLMDMDKNKSNDHRTLVLLMQLSDIFPVCMYPTNSKYSNKINEKWFIFILKSKAD